MSALKNSCLEFVDHLENLAHSGQTISWISNSFPINESDKHYYYKLDTSSSIPMRIQYNYITTSKKNVFEVMKTILELVVDFEKVSNISSEEFVKKLFYSVECRLASRREIGREY